MFSEGISQEKSRVLFSQPSIRPDSFWSPEETPPAGQERECTFLRYFFIGFTQQNQRLMPALYPQTVSQEAYFKVIGDEWLFNFWGLPIIMNLKYCNFSHQEIQLIGLRDAHLRVGRFLMVMVTYSFFGQKASYSIREVFCPIAAIHILSKSANY